MTASVSLLQICFLSASSNALFRRNRHPLNLNRAVVSRRAKLRRSLAITTRTIATNTTTNTTTTTTTNNNGTTATDASASSVSPASITFRTSSRYRRSCFGSTALSRRRRISSFLYCPPFLSKSLRSIARPRLFARRRKLDTLHLPSRKHLALEQMLATTRAGQEEVSAERPAPLPSSSHLEQGAAGGTGDPEPSPPSGDMSSRVRPISTSTEDLGETRSTRSSSTTSRSTNRLSLTLPIAPPTACPSRPVPAPSPVPSYPPTPLDTPSVMSPVSPSDFIPAIAAQERRVLELREELVRAETELVSLKKQWATHESYRKRQEARASYPSRHTANNQAQAQAQAQADSQDDSSSRRSVDLDRRKAMLMGQQSQPSTPGQNRRRVFRGGHTRTLSLLSPTKSDSFSVHEDDAPERTMMPLGELDSPYVDRYAPIVPAQLPKRASWAPRTTHHHQGPGVKQIAQDFKAGLWTFMEDLRQATVGEEPITGHGLPLRGIDPNGRFIPLHKTVENYRQGSSPSGDQDTIRASGVTSRPLAASVFEKSPSPATRNSDSRKQEKDSAPSLSDAARASQHKRDASRKESSKTTKRFSWTPLTVNSYDDNDWSNWDSPSITSPRWSGTTVNGDIIPAIPEKDSEKRSQDRNGRYSTPDRDLQSESGPSSPSPSPSSPHKFEELIPPVLNRLTPGNLKRTASDFMKEWEKSLSPPPETTAFPHGDKCRVD